MRQGGRGISKMTMTKLCDHIKDNGLRCGSPALRGRCFCYHHDREFRRLRILKTAGCKLVPGLKNPRDLRVATTNILRALRNGLLAPPDAVPMLYGLQIARSLLPGPRKRKRHDRPQCD